MTPKSAALRRVVWNRSVLGRRDAGHAVTPKWVTDLVRRSAVDPDIGTGSIPLVVWRRSSHDQSSGHCRYYGRMVVTAGTDRRDARLVLLHEIAHFRTGRRVGRSDPTVWGGMEFEHHGDAFYRQLFRLVAWDAKLPWRMVLDREGRYMAQAIKTAIALGLPGAKAAGRRTRASRKARSDRQPRGWCPIPLPECHFTRTPERRHTHYLGASFHVLIGEAMEDFTVTEPVASPWDALRAAGGGK